MTKNTFNTRYSITVHTKLLLFTESAHSDTGDFFLNNVSKIS